MKDVGTIGWVAIVLVVIGGVNYGLVGFFDYNLLEVIFGKTAGFARVFYSFIGVAAVWVLFAWSRCCRGGED